jgi:hypothetical protein
VVATNRYLDETGDVVSKRNSLLGALLSDAVEAESVRKPCARWGSGKDLAEMSTICREGCRCQCVLPETTFKRRKALGNLNKFSSGCFLDLMMRLIVPM